MSNDYPVDQEPDMLSVYMPTQSFPFSYHQQAPPTISPRADLSTGVSTPCTCCIKCSQERIYKNAISSSPSSTSATASMKKHNQELIATATKTKIFKPTILMAKHVSMDQATSPRKRTFEDYTGEQRGFVQNTDIQGTTKAPRLQYVDEKVMTDQTFDRTPSSNRILFTDHQQSFHYKDGDVLAKRDAFHRQGRRVKSLEYYEGLNKETIEKVSQATTPISRITARVPLLVSSAYGRRSLSPSRSSSLYEPLSPASSSYSSLIPTPPPPLIRTPQPSPLMRSPASSTTIATVGSSSLMKQPTDRRVKSAKLKASSFDSNIDSSSLSGSDEDDTAQVGNNTKVTQHAVVGKS